ncbi:hypothetical protein D4764_16G0000050 [Takifugu flavidus]|uniref:Uncharacterized protein n=1 Tax=Takifugu flavidus TaxID=433684 RepID=A0A5C6NXH0_9TELE|nr:hypothetical protein D4764_16G0000050 [Takifugu flavidus]
MVSSVTPSLSIRHGVRVQPDPSVPVEEVLLAVGDQVGHANLSYTSRMNRGVVVFVKEQQLVAELVGRGLTLNGAYLQLSPLTAPSTWVTVSGVPLFISNEALEQELLHFGKMASGLRTVGLGCRTDKLKHMLSLRRQCCPSQTIDVSFRVRHGDGQVSLALTNPSCIAPPSSGGDEVAADAGGGPSGQVEEQRGAGECLAAVRAGREGAVEEVQTGVTEEVQMGVNVQTGAAEEEEQTGAEEEEQTGAEGVSGDQGQVAGVQLTDQSVEMLVVDEGEEVMESDSGSDCLSVADSHYLSGDLYTLEDVTSFLDETVGQSVKVADNYPDAEKFLKSALMLQKAVGVNLLNERKRFRLKHDSDEKDAEAKKKEKG